MWSVFLASCLVSVSALTTPVCKNDAGETVACADLPLDDRGLPQAVPYYISPYPENAKPCINMDGSEVPCADLQFDNQGRPTSVYTARGPKLIDTCFNDAGERVKCIEPDDEEACPIFDNDDTVVANVTEEVLVGRRKRAFDDTHNILDRLLQCCCNYKYRFGCFGIDTNDLGDASFAIGGKDMHNRMPERKGNPYKMRVDLCKSAINHANKLARRDDADSDPHDRNTNQGENIAYRSEITRTRNGRVSYHDSPRPDAKVVVKQWYNEKYPGHEQYTKYGLNHYTQAVWADAKYMCMATRKAKSGAWWTVARYDQVQISNSGYRSRNVKDQNSRPGNRVCCGSQRKARNCGACGTTYKYCGGQCTPYIAIPYSNDRSKCI